METRRDNHHARDIKWTWWLISINTFLFRKELITQRDSNKLTQ
jgi:hypothetical protein